jgi:hypothetical protein
VPSTRSSPARASNSFDSRFGARAERSVGTVRRELLDHLLIFGRDHLTAVLEEFLNHYHEAGHTRVSTSTSPLPTPLQ